MTETVQKLAPQILAEIEKATNILLHCHVSPDMDSVGGALAMMHVLEKMGKKVTVIRGDSEMPQAFSFAPGFEKIVPKHFFELDLAQFDLFIIQDTGSSGHISTHEKIVFPPALNTIIIDHHKSNEGYAKLNLIDPAYPANCQILYDLFKIWNVELNREIALNLFMGMYTDTGGFKYPTTTKETFLAAAELVSLAPDYTKAVATLENSNTPGYLKFQALALESVTTHFNNTVAIASLAHEQLFEGTGIEGGDIRGSDIAAQLRSVLGWNIGISMMEENKGFVKMSLRSRDGDIYDVSKIAVELGGGGHKAASGAGLKMALPEAKAKVLEAIAKVYPEFGAA